MKPAHTETPLWESSPLSEILGVPVFLKMEAFQPVGSFKARGMGAACSAAYEQGFRKVVCSSGGNAGLAVAYAGRKLGMEVTIVVPESTSERAKMLIQREGAAVQIHGDAWDDAHEHAVILAAMSHSAYVHPFDDPEIWRGHGTLVHEIYAAGVRPGGIVVSVGGGGLLAGILHGMDELGWGEIPVVAVETDGTDSFAQSMAAGRLVTLQAIRSIASTLGARTVCSRVLQAALSHNVTPFVVSDRQAVNACKSFATDHRVLVEPACGAALAVGYDRANVLDGLSPLVFIVCGGAAVTPEMLAEWDQKV